MTTGPLIAALAAIGVAVAILGYPSTYSGAPDVASPSHPLGEARVPWALRPADGQERR